MKRLSKMLPYPVFAHQAISWEFLESVVSHDSDFESAANELDSLLDVEYGNEFIYRAWSRLFRIHGSIYIEATYEFFSTFEYNGSKSNIHKKSIRFMLGGQLRRLSIVEFGVAFGLYDEDDLAHLEFENHVKEGRKVLDFSQNVEMWNEIASGGYNGVGRAPSYTLIRDPKIRIICYILVLVVIGRKSGLDKVHKEEMFLLGCIT